MKTKLLSLAIAALTLFAAKAATLRVEQGGGGQYTTISAAIAAASDNDTIAVGPGAYEENLVIDKSLTLVGAGPQHVTIRAASTQNNPDATAIFIGDMQATVAVMVMLDGFTITSGYANGIVVQPLSSATIQHCIVSDCKHSGIYHDSSPSRFGTASTAIRIRHCTIANNTSWGVHVVTAAYGSVLIEDSIIAGNFPAHSYQCYFYTYSGYIGVTVGRIARDTRPGLYTGANWSVSHPIPEVGGNLRFVDAARGNFVLLPGSVAKDIGTPGIGMLEPDGTRCDVGAFSGPTAARFWPYPIGGPVVRDVSVGAAVVTQGGTLNLRATATTR